MHLFCAFLYIHCFVYSLERFSVPVLKIQSEDPKIQSGSSLTLTCTSEIFSNDTLTYSFFNGEKKLIHNGTNQTHVIGQMSTNDIGNYTCQSKLTSLMRNSTTVLINGKPFYTLFIYLSYS